MKNKGKITMPREKRFIKLNKTSYERDSYNNGELKEVTNEVYLNPDHILFFERVAKDENDNRQRHIPDIAKTVICMSGGAVIYSDTEASHLSFVLGTRELRK